MTLRAATPQDVLTIQQLAEKIWYDHYIHIITEEQIAYMLDKMYSQESLRHQMTEQQHEFYMLQEAGQSIGFISIKRNGPEVFINKFYILSDKQNSGRGSLAFLLLKEVAEPFEKMRLTVNRQNYKSINFYFKNEFKIEKVEDFKIGNGYEMNDFIMVYRHEANSEIKSLQEEAKN